MDWKIVTGGMIATLVLLFAMSAANAVWGITSDSIHVSIPGRSEIRNVRMCGGQYNNKTVVIQEIPGTLACPYGQVIKRKINVGGIENVVIKFDNAVLSGVKMYAAGLSSPSGLLENVEMGANPLTYLEQRIENAYMDNLNTDIYFAQIGSLVYKGLSIYFE